MKGLPDNIKRLIDASVPEHMRDYYYRMVMKESSGRPDLTSPTGAKGLLQFTRGTGKLYGLIGPEGDRRTDPKANIEAGVRLTEDNRRTMARILKREPSFSELALGHQQGAETAARMILGTGNAPAQNLAVNRVDPNASPQAAASQIMNYYGFGDRNQIPYLQPGQMPQGPIPGVSLSYNPMAGPQAPMPMPPPSQFAPTAAPPVTPPPAPPPTATDQIMGELGKTGGNSPLDDIAKGISPKVNPAVAAEAAKITPMAADASGAGAAQAAQALMAQLLQKRRGAQGLTLTGGY